MRGARWGVSRAILKRARTEWLRQKVGVSLEIAIVATGQVYMLTGQTGHSSPDTALSRQARQWALSFRTPPSHPSLYLECTPVM